MRACAGRGTHHRLPADDGEQVTPDRICTPEAKKEILATRSSLSMKSKLNTRCDPQSKISLWKLETGNDLWTSK